MLHILYRPTAIIPLLFAKHLTTGYLYVDAIQDFVYGSQLISSVDAFTHDLHFLMSSNPLCLNSAIRPN